MNREDKGELRRQWHIENKESGYAGRHIPLDCPANNNMGRAMTSWETMVNRKVMSPFEKTMVNKCHAKRDTKNALRRSRTFSLVCFGISTRLCPLNSLLSIIPTALALARAAKITLVQLHLAAKLLAPLVLFKRDALAQSAEQSCRRIAMDSRQIRDRSRRGARNEVFHQPSCLFLPDLQCFRYICQH